MVEEAQLITKIKTAFPKEESEHKDIHGTELVAVAVGILLSLAFITYSNSSSFFIMLVICLMGGFFGYFYQREKITEFISSIFNPWSRAMERKGPVLICIYCWEHRRMRGRRLPMSSSDPRRPRGDLRTTNRQDSIDAPALAASSISRIKKIIFFGPQ